MWLPFRLTEVMREQTPLSDLLTLVNGATACISEPSGGIRRGTWQGIYHRDIRVVSQLRLTAGGREPPLVASRRDGASAATQVHMLAQTGTDPTALLLRRREVAGDVVEHLEVQVFSDADFEVDLVITLGADFATLHASREGIDHEHPSSLEPCSEAGLCAADSDAALRVEADGEGLAVERNQVSWHVRAARGRPWHGTLRLSPSFSGTPAAERHAGTAGLRVESTADGWQRSVVSATSDLAALEVDVAELDLRYIAAGVPWFMALFGRDALITAYQSLVTGSGAALAVLRALARYQGKGYDAHTLEEPGRILHEMRTGGSEVFGVPSGVPYYGSVDATPLFVMLLAEAHRWGAPDADISALLPAARKAVAWCTDVGDVDGDGFVEYAAHAGALGNLAWKDSGDAMVHADGSLAKGPIAAAEVQAYVYGAYTGLALLEERLGDASSAATLRRRADDLRAAFHDQFWLAEEGIVAMALDGDKEPLKVASSNMGHCLWAGVLDDDAAEAVAARLTAPDMVTRWGVRTLARTETAYNPFGYHVGSVWPHDTAIVAAGLMRYGHVAEAAHLAEGLLEVCRTFGWRLPELFAGFDSDQVPLPVPYPAACTPQAWSATAPLLLLRMMLRLEPDVPAGTVRLAPVFEDGTSITLRGIRLGSGRLDLAVRGSSVEVLAAPEGLDLVVV